MDLLDPFIVRMMGAHINRRTVANVRKADLEIERMEELAEAEDLGPNDRQRLSAIQEAWDAARGRYPEQFQEKLRQEHDSYLRNWKYFLENMARDPDRWKEEYEVELRNRRRVELIRRIMGPDAPPDLADLDELEEDLEEQATQD